MAFKGSDATGKKGILELCADITAALRASTLDNFFYTPITDMRVWHGKGKKGGYSLWLGTVSFSAEILVERESN